MGAFSSKAATAKASPPPPTVSAVDRAVLDLKVSRDRLQKYRTQLEKDQEKLIQQARKAKLDGKKDRALGLLRLKQYKSTQARNCEAQLLNVLQMVDTIDSKQNEQQMLQALKVGKESLAQMHKETTVEDVLQLMESVRDQVAVEQEIASILEHVPELSPDAELQVEAELAALMEETESATAEPPQLPTAPTTQLPHVEVATTATTTTVQPTTAKPARVAVLG